MRIKYIKFNYHGVVVKVTACVWTNDHFSGPQSLIEHLANFLVQPFGVYPGSYQLQCAKGEAEIDL